jgi:hypothetical protein
MWITLKTGTLLSFALIGVSSLACSTDDPESPAGPCMTDLDCKGDRICESGQCQAPSSASVGGTDGSGGSGGRNGSGGSGGSGGKSSAGGSGGTDGMTSGSTAIEAWIADFAAALCTSTYDCGCSEDGPGFAACVDEVTADLDTQAAAALDRGLTFSAACAQRQIDYYAREEGTLHCLGIGAVTLASWDAPWWCSVFEGSSEGGADCTLTRAIGISQFSSECGPTTYGCQSDRCVGAPASGYVGEDGTCAPDAQPPLFGGACQAGLYCNGEVEPPRCRRLLPGGEPCTEDCQCDSQSCSGVCAEPEHACGRSADLVACAVVPDVGDAPAEPGGEPNPGSGGQGGTSGGPMGAAGNPGAGAGGTFGGGVPPEPPAEPPSAGAGGAPAVPSNPGGAPG